MILRIIAFAVILCLNLGTFSLANQKSTSNLPTLKWERSVKTRIFLGTAIGLAGSIVAATNKEKDIKGDNAALGVALVGFGYAFFNWMKLHPPSSTGFTYTSPRKGHYERRIIGYELQRNPVYDALKQRPLYIDIPYGGWSDEDLHRMGFNEYNVVPQYDWIWVPDE
jgi:hypothetical protein